MENFNAMFDSFFNDTLQLTFPWFFAMAAIIILDLIFGVKKALYVGDDVRISNAFRRTMSKTLSYFWFVITVGVIDAATTLDFKITTWACLIVCVIELSSVISNFLKIKGYKFNKEKGFDFIVRKTMKRLGVDSLEKGEITDLIEKDEEVKKTEETMKKEGE